MEDIIRLQLLEPSDSNVIYRDAKQSYREIYNNAMAKGKGNLEPKFLGGNPIQLDTGNMNSLFEYNNKKLHLRDYFVSTKADGLRFMLLIGNKNVDGSRGIYLVDSRINFWIITQDILGNFPNLPLDLNVDKCLLDGELLFWGQITTRKNQHTKQIKEYIIKKERSQKPLVAFLAFDILYGPTNPDYVIPKDREITTNVRSFELGGSGAMIGPKATGRWPTNRRRHVLEQLILNKESPFYSFLHDQTSYNPNRIEYLNNNAIKNQTHYNFTVFVSPFVEMGKLLQMLPNTDIYEYMKDILHKSIEDQYYYIDSITKKHIKLQIPQSPKNTSISSGKGYSADGLIFTPAIESYLQGPWTFCNNKQYKWKPNDQLTIDFEVGNKIGDNYYYGIVKDGKNKSVLHHSIDNNVYTAAIMSESELQQGEIVECSYLLKQSEKEAKQNDKNERYIIFNVKQIREDKDDPNARLTAVSVLNASDLTNNLSFLKVKNPNILDLVVKIIQSVKYPKNDTTEQINIISSFGKEKLIKCTLSRNPELLLEKYRNKILELIRSKQENKTYELEIRIDLGSTNNYSDCLLSNFIDSDYTPVPIIKVFDKSNNPSTSVRSVYVMIGDTEDTLILEETIKKVQIDEVKIKEDIYNYSFGIHLSDEIKTDTPVIYNSSNAGNSEYQNRYTITNLSNFWRVDIIEYGNSKDIKQAKLSAEQKPRTRVEIEYAPASFIEDILKWDNYTALHHLLSAIQFKEEIKDLNVFRDDLLKKLPKFKEELNNTSPELVLKDLSNVLIKIFNTLDMDLGNSYTSKEEVTEKVSEKPKITKTTKDTEEDSVQSETDLFTRLRKFHNYIKSSLIEEVVSHLDHPVSLLDISVGKGGDIFKWNKAGIENVYGIDPDKDSITEAKNRLKKAGLKNRKYTFENIKITDPGVVIPGKYDIVSCQFTLHYFFESPEMLDSAIKQVSNALKPGGFFIGTTMIQKNVKELINNNHWTEYIDISKIDDKSYRMKLKDETVYSSKLPEYYVDFEQFKRKCKEYGLILESTSSFSELYKQYIKKNKALKPYEKAVSDLNVTFIFTKK